MDCGDSKAGVDSNAFTTLLADLNKSNNYSKVSGTIMFQVLIDSTGAACVLSHTDVSKSKITMDIVDKFNAFTGWVPAKTEGKAYGRTSIIVLATIKEGVLTSTIQRVDNKAFMKGFDHPTNPEIYNKSYRYKNEHLKDYIFTVFSEKNSNLPNNFLSDVAVDKDNKLWLTIDEGLVQFDGTSFTRTEQNITEKGKYFSYSAIAADNNNVKWVTGKGRIYNYDNKAWQLHDSTKIGFLGAYKIENNPGTGELFFCVKGLHILRQGSWSVINTSNTKGLPSDKVDFANRDSKGRLWIGTYEGSVMIDKDGKVINFNNTETVLKNRMITSMAEDEQGTLYFSLYEYNPKDHKEVNRNEGLAIYDNNGNTRIYSTSNSGLPFNHITKVLYDKNEKILWLSSDRAGLIRYDLKNGWENYHNKNSDIPTSYIADMVFDNNGLLYLVTRQGLVRVNKR